MIRLLSGHMALIVAEIWTYPIVNIGLAEPGMGSWVDTIGWVDDGRCPLGESLGIIFLNGLHPLSPEVGFNFFGPVSQDSMCDLYENVWPSGSNHFQPPDGQKMILCLLTLGFDLAIDERKTSRCQRFPVGVMVVQYGAIFRFLQAIRI